MTDVNAWFALGGALGGVALTGLIGLLTASLTHRWSERDRVTTQREQDSRTIRDQRREVSHNYLVATNSFYQAIDQLHLLISRGDNVEPREYLRSAIMALQDAYAYLTITCGAQVRDLAHQYNVELYALSRAAQRPDANGWAEHGDESYKARRRLRAAIRAELGVPD